MVSAVIRKRYTSGPESAEFALQADLEAGEGVTVLFGPSGSGKTLTLDCIAGFVQPDSGRVLFDGECVFDSEKRINVKPQQRRCGYVLQTEALFPHMTLRENLEFAADRFRRVEGHRRVNEVIERFRLAGVSGRRPREVSGGQRQRCAIARALITEPRVLLLDEPARGLDAPLRSDLYSVLRQVRSEFNIPVLLVTHDVEECFEIGDVMYVVQDGSFVQKGTPAAVAERPSSPEVAQLLGSINLFQAEITMLDPSRNSSRLRINGVEIQGLYYPGRFKGNRVWIHIPPHAIQAFQSDVKSEKALRVRLDSTSERPGAMRLRFAEGFVADVPRPGIAYSPDNKDWVIEIPPEAIRVY